MYDKVIQRVDERDREDWSDMKGVERNKENMAMKERMGRVEM